MGKDVKTMSKSSTNMTEIDYESLMEDALRNVLRGALRIVETQGLPGESHFFITFASDREDVMIPPKLRAQFPEQMTIVIQYQFRDLITHDQHFEITLTFDGVEHSISVPFDAVIEFSDPTAGFGLQFSTIETIEETPAPDTPDTPATANPPSNNDAESKDDSGGKSSADIISLAGFRDKKS